MTAEDARELAVVVVNHGSSELLLRNLARHDPRPVAACVVVVDNHSSDEHTVEVRALARREGWEFVSAANLGFGAGVNAGVERARDLGCTVFLLLNPDAWIERDALAALLRDCRAHPMRLLAPRILRDDGSTWFDGGELRLDRGRTSTAPGADSSAENGWLTGACLMVHDALWRRVGGFDDDYFLYWEDVDLSWRCRESGGGLVVRHDLAVVHSVGGTQGAGGKPPMYVYYNCRNRMLFAGKHLRRRAVLGWLAWSPAYAWRVLGRGGRRALLHRPVGLVWAAIRGTVSGSILALRTASP